MLKPIMCLFLSVALFSFGGCASTKSSMADKDLEVQGLKNHIQALETELQNKEQEITVLKESLERPQEYSSSKRPYYKKYGISKVKSRPTVKHIQIALKNAGYKPGTIDGRMGKETRLAIKSFQKDNKLQADGKVGKSTWQALRKYLEEK